MGLSTRSVTGLTDVYLAIKGADFYLAIPEGSGTSLCWYEATDLMLANAGLPASPDVGYSGAFLRGNVNSPDLANDTEIAVFSNFHWDGTNEIDRDVVTIEVPR